MNSYSIILLKVREIGFVNDGYHVQKKLIGLYLCCFKHKHWILSINTLNNYTYYFALLIV